MNILYPSLALLLILTGSGCDVEHSILESPSQDGGIGFLTPRAVPPELVAKTDFAMINAYSTTQVADSLKTAQGHAFKVHITLGIVLTPAMDRAAIKTVYQSADGQPQSKVFPPAQVVKLHQFPADEQIRQIIGPYFDVLQQYQANVGTIFLADEPYVNGLTKAELERAAKVVREELDTRGLQAVKLGVIFASGMFDKEFAALLAAEAARYTAAIDQHYLGQQAYIDSGKATAEEAASFAEWVSVIRNSRLSTYDSTGNMYIDGGVPEGFDVVGFDFYLSTVLLDVLHNQTLSWLAERYPEAGCSQFSGKGIAQIRSELSFFSPGPVVQGDEHRVADSQLLDSIYQCRMQALTTMLQRSVQGRDLQLMMISESSNNGVLEFDPAGTVEAAQPGLLVEARALDEVKRAEKFFHANRSVYSAGLMFFTYDNEYDASINLNIGGATGMPRVLNRVLDFAKSH